MRGASVKCIERKNSVGQGSPPRKSNLSVPRPAPYSRGRRETNNSADDFNARESEQQNY